MNLAGEWFLIEHVLAGATARVSKNYRGKAINWEIVDQSVRLAGLAAGCALMEKAGLKGANEHVTVLFDLRNALIHNSGDVSKNAKRTALTEAQDYLLKNKHSALSNELANPFFSLSGSVVQLESSIYFAIRLCLI